MTKQSYQQDEVEDVENPFEKECATAMIIRTVHVDGTHTRVTMHSARLVV